MFKSKLENYRSHIDQIDEKILCLLNERIEVSFNIANLKKYNNVGLLDGNREKEMIEERVNSNYGQQLPKKLVESIFTSILKHC